MVPKECDVASRNGHSTNLAESGDAPDPTVQHIGRTEATIVLRPITKTRTCALRESLSPGACVDEHSDPAACAAFGGGFDMARRNAFVQATGSVSGAERFKFFTYMPKSFDCQLTESQNTLEAADGCWKPEQSAPDEICWQEEERSSGPDNPAFLIPRYNGGQPLLWHLGVLTSGWNCSKATQSVLREEEVQTDPYSPDYVYSPKGQHDEIAISHFCWARGLPATSREIRVIKEMQVQRRLDQLLPPPTDEFCLAIRTTLMERQEFFKWAQRERDIRELQDRRLQLVKIALKLRATKLRSKSNAALRRRQEVLKEQMQRKQLLIERCRLKDLRRLWRRRNEITQAVTNPLCAANKIENSGSLKHLVPPARDGYRPPDAFTSLFAQHLACKKDFEALEIMEAHLCNSGVTTAVSLTPTLGPRKTYATVRKDMSRSKALEHKAAMLQREVAELLTGTSLQLDLAAAPPTHSMSEGGSVAARRLMKRNIRTRPETPRVDEVPTEEEQEHLAVLLLQQLLRGAARRHFMFKGKEKSLDLVSMLRAAEQLQDIPPEQQQKAVDRQTAFEAAEVLLASAQGAAIAEVLDELAKEQRRMEEVQRISALAHLAVRERRLREAQEAGTRQAEEMIRERENEAFCSAMGIHNQTVDSYLQTLIEKAGAGNAQDEALVEVRLHAKQLAQVVDDLEERLEAPETIVGGLVKGFLIPALARQCQQREEQLESHKFHVASRLAVEESVSSALSELVLQPGSTAHGSNDVMKSPHTVGKNQVATGE